jgi:hypothetical protein
MSERPLEESLDEVAAAGISSLAGRLCCSFVVDAPVVETVPVPVSASGVRSESLGCGSFRTGRDLFTAEGLAA